METTVYADRDGRVAEVLVSAGTQVETKQLLMVVNGGEGGDGEDDQPENGGGGEAGDGDGIETLRGAQLPRTAGSGAPSDSQLVASTCQLGDDSGTTPLAMRSR